ncbi:MAG: DUF1573 domain-containing protein [Rikenellaceae bacterium]|jgi:hypothetical protein|nr:DUF1573 domain-containing protein [Rikenellaceae bacterium]
MRSLILTALAVLLAGVAAAATPQPAIRFDDPAHDFGRIPARGEVRKHSFIFRNEGTTPLIILKCYTSCTCATITFPKQPVMPGNSAAIRVSYDPEKQQGTGAFFKTIQVYSNDPEKRSILTIKGEIFSEE